MIINTNVSSLRAILIMAASLNAAGAALAADSPYGGSDKDPSIADIGRTFPRLPIDGQILSYTHAQYSTGGGALRNRPSTSLDVSGVIAPVQPNGAWLYWAVILNTPVDPAAVSSIRIRRDSPLPATPNVTVAGTLVGRGASPCWGGDHISVYRAPVPVGVANGNGSYQVTILPGGAGAVNGADPWGGAPRQYPLWEGASLVMVGAGTQNVSLYDAGFMAGRTFANSVLAYALPLVGGRTAGPALWETIGADGQVGFSRLALAGATTETTTINGAPVSGPGAPDNDSDWNGNAGAPLPQLWDDTGHDITGPATGAAALNVAIRTNGDCITGVANVVQY